MLFYNVFIIGGTLFRRLHFTTIMYFLFILPFLCFSQNPCFQCQWPSYLKISCASIAMLEISYFHNFCILMERSMICTHATNAYKLCFCAETMKKGFNIECDYPQSRWNISRPDQKKKQLQYPVLVELILSAFNHPKKTRVWKDLIIECYEMFLYF